MDLGRAGIGEESGFATSRWCEFGVGSLGSLGGLW